MFPKTGYELLDKGWTADIYILPDNQKKVCKTFPGKYAATHFPVEKEAYERLTANNPPSTIPKYYGINKEIGHFASITLELAENGSLYKYLWDNKIYNRPPITRETFHRWARQAAEALAFSHSCGVFHSDIHVVNFLLDKNLDLKVADFAGASIDGKISMSFYRITHQLFNSDDDPSNRDLGKRITVETEIFALGSALYFMVTGQDVFEPELDYEKDQGEIIRRLKAKEMPETEGLVLGAVISGCWGGGYKSMTEVVEGIGALGEEID